MPFMENSAKNIPIVKSDSSDINVIVTCFNDEKSIIAALESVKRQTTERLSRVYVIDNMSTDRSRELIEEFCSNNSAFEFHEQRKAGVPAARNLGLALSRSKYIAFLDADDYWAPEKVETQIKYMEENQALFSYTDVFMHGNDTEQIFHCPSLPDGIEQQTKFLLKFSPAIFPSTMVADRRLLEALGGFDERFLKGQDTLLCLYVSTMTKLHRVPRPLTIRKLREGSLGAGYDKKRKYLYNAIGVFLSDFPKYQYLEADAKYAVDMHYLQRAFGSFGEYSRREVFMTISRHLLRRSMYPHLARLIFGVG